MPNILGNFYPEDKVELYFETFAESSNMLKFLCWTLAHLAFVSLIYYVYRRTPKTYMSKFIYNVNILSILIIPLYKFDPVFMRLFRVVVIYNYIYLCNLIPATLMVKKKDLVATVGVMVLAIMYCYIWYWSGIGNMTFERMIQPIFEDNLLMD